MHAHWSVHGLAARHRDGIVEQDLVGNVRAGRDRLSNGERT